MKFPRHTQIAKGPFDLLPALNVVLLLLFLVPLGGAIMMSPGTTVELPTSATFAIPAGRTLVVTVTRETMIFFRDRRYTAEELPKLGHDLAAAAKEIGVRTLTLKADKQVSYDLLVQIADVATKAGLTTVNLATRPLPSPTP